MTWNGSAERLGCLGKWHSAPSRNWPGECWSGRWNRECPSASHGDEVYGIRPPPDGRGWSGETFRQQREAVDRDGLATGCGRTGWRLGWRNPMTLGAAQRGRRRQGTRRVYDWAWVEILEGAGQGDPLAASGAASPNVCFGPVLEELVRPVALTLEAKGAGGSGPV